MKIAELEILELRIPFRFTFKHALAERSEGHGVLVRVRDEEGREGYGECVPRSYVTGETPESVIQTLRTHLAPPFVGRRLGSFEETVAALTAPLDTLPRDRHAAFCALEMAILDLAGHRWNRSAGDVLGPVLNAEVEYTGVVSADDLPSSLQVLEHIRKFGFRHVKLKVGGNPEDDLRLLATAREVLGPACRLRIDANCAWTAEEALIRLASFAPFDLEAVEQPLAAEDLDGLVEVTARTPIPVIVDESLVCLDDAKTLIARRACHHFNIRISKCGGLINSGRLRDTARAAGIGYQLGAQVGETVILSAAGRHFASRTAGVLFSEGSFGTILLESDIGIDDLTLAPGRPALALEGPGLGVRIDPDRLGRYVVSTIVVGDA